MLLKVAAVFFLAAGGFLIYGATVANGSTDMVVRGLIAMGGFMACAVIGVGLWLVWIIQQLAKKREPPSEPGA